VLFRSFQMSAFPESELPDEVVALINEASTARGLTLVLSALLSACREIGDGLRNCSYSAAKVGTQNTFGDNQLDVDVKTDAVIFRYLKSSGKVSVAASEENPTEINCEGDGYSVSFDPLDGSSIMDANFAVGTIAGIWPGTGFLNRLGREQEASLIAQYGPRVTIALSLNSFSTVSGDAISMELTMMPERWAVSIPRISIAQSAKTFAPGNLRAVADNPNYNDLIMFWISNKYTLRYSGGLVPDVYHILIKGEGVLSNASSSRAKAKLRLLFEAAPIALIVESAGGLSCCAPSEAGESMSVQSILDVPVSDLDKRVGVCFGSSEEVVRFQEYLFSR